MELVLGICKCCATKEMVQLIKIRYVTGKLKTGHSLSVFGRLTESAGSEDNCKCIYPQTLLMLQERLDHTVFMKSNEIYKLS